MAPLLRTTLLLLIAVLLPLRGAVAASMACAVVPVTVMAHADPHAGHPGHDAAPATAAADAKCSLCAAAGAAAPLPVAPPQLALPAACAVLQYPPLAVAFTAFVADGPERPPRG